MMYLLIFSLIVGFSYYFIENTKALHMLQQNWYNEGNRYIKWIKSNLKKVFVDLDIFFISFIIFKFIDKNLSMVLFTLFYILCLGNFLNNKKKEQDKTK